MSYTCGIVAEFNPFHNGHRALINAARAQGADTVVCVMSGNFVQRGSPAITDKGIRTRAALECGADLVIELPLPCAISTAQRFARGAIHLLSSLVCVDMLAFGSEAGEIEGLDLLARAIDEPQVTEKMRRILKDGMTFAKARELSVSKFYGEKTASMLRSPNNVLAIEYLRQARIFGWKIKPVTIKRVGVEHHEQNARNGFASASYLRENISDFMTLAENVPEKAARIYAKAIEDGLFPSQAEKLEASMLSHLRRLSLSELSILPDISEGIENRFYSAVREATSLGGLELLLKTKRYTMARIRRLILSAYLGVIAKDVDTPPPYVRILGFNANGRSLLKPMKEKCRLPVDVSLASLRERGGMCGRFAALEELSTDLYGLSLPKPLTCGYEYTRAGIFLDGR